MKINENYIMRNIAGEIIIIPTGKAAQYFNGLISTNEVAGFIWENIEKCETVEEMVNLVYSEFDEDIDIIRKDVIEFLNTLKQVQMIDFDE